ncbi:BTB/POZ protein [Hypoxylon trugodes]|uniref:BTB/POZ protein n=1 Tax=Hypoxylon trugodes TaxID=326681 RepID=UPI00219A8461|nr:BTB/POZ protein [Hypoxylon trugodes]KAI1391853.1 BTB/POZ protein [Hypoxylon trugodes]
MSLFGINSPSLELADSLRKLYRSEEYSDLIITCRGKQYKVHKAVVCPRSEFFATACRGNFKEARDGRIDLPEDDPAIVEKMIFYLYNLDYTTSQTTTPSLVVHARVYALAEKYLIGGLKATALTKFRAIVDNISSSSDEQRLDFAKAAREVYTSTVDVDTGLRDVILETLHKNPKFLDQKECRSILKELPTLTYDLLMRVRENGYWPKQPIEEPLKTSSLFGGVGSKSSQGGLFGGGPSSRYEQPSSSLFVQAPSRSAFGTTTSGSSSFGNFPS